MIKVFFDGASAGNPGASGIGIFLHLGQNKFSRYSYPVGTMSNHEAEWVACVKALEICQAMGYKKIVVHTDSQLVEQSIEKGFVKNNQFKPYLEQALKYINQLDLFFIKWIPSKQNKVADELARQAIIQK